MGRIAARAEPPLPLCIAFATLLTSVVACGGTWQGKDLHLVDGTWIGAETECSDGDEGLECRTVLEAASRALPLEVRDRMTRIVLANLPTTFVTATGETRMAHTTAGIATRRAVVIDLVDGSRRVIGLWCHIPYGSDGRLEVDAVDCGIDPLDDWRDGGMPPPPGTDFG